MVIHGDIFYDICHRAIYPSNQHIQDDLRFDSNYSKCFQETERAFIYTFRHSAIHIENSRIKIIHWILCWICGQFEFIELN